LGDLGQAIRWYSRSVAQYPFNVSNNYMLGRALVEPVLARFRGPYRPRDASALLGKGKSL
jgi:hypothetical protein